MHICKICGKENINLLKMHIKNQHEGKVEEYLNSMNVEELQRYKDIENNLKYKRQINSPKCIEFYLTRGASLEEAQKRLKEHNENSTEKLKGKEKYPTSKEYWLLKGFAEEDAINKMKISRLKVTNSYNGFLFRTRDKKLARQKFKQYKESLKYRKDVFIKNNIAMGMTEKEANEKFIEQRRYSSSKSKLTKKYWLDKGFTEEETKKQIYLLQRNKTPRYLGYWKNLGYPEKEAKEMMRKFSDHSSPLYLAKKYNLDIEDIMKNRYNIASEKELINTFKKYKNRVRRMSDITYKLYKNLINPDNMTRGNDFHLDHKLSLVDCFIFGISTNIASSLYNLEILTAEDNLIKREKSSISAEELVMKYEENILNEHRISKEI